MTNNYTWLTLNDALPCMKEQEVKRLLEAERRGARRSTVLKRLHQRFCALRAAREWMEIVNDTARNSKNRARNH